MERIGTLVIGAGQAGLAVSHELGARQIPHLVLERGRVGQTWRDRWDSFCLVTPNWTVQLPGRRYSGSAPDGYLPRDDIWAWLVEYAHGFAAPVREGVEVERLERAPTGGFVASTTAGPFSADQVVVCTGAFQRPHLPAGAATLPRGLLAIDLTSYTSPGDLPPGRVLIVGSGQSGCQLAEELAQAGRDVVLSCGRAPWVPRRIGDRDIFWWLQASGFFETPTASLPPAARLLSNPLTTGHDGGHDLHLRTLRRMGVTLVGRFLGADGPVARFASDLGASVAWGDERHGELLDLIRRTAASLAVPLPDLLPPAPFDPTAPDSVSLDGFGAVIFSGGFRPDYRRWMPWPDAFDESGFPIQVDGRSTVVDGLFFVGVHFLRTRKSSILLGVGEDAAVVASAIAGGRIHPGAAGSTS